MPIFLPSPLEHFAPEICVFILVWQAAPLFIPPSVWKTGKLPELSPGWNFVAVHVEGPLHYVAVWWWGKSPKEVFLCDSMHPPHTLGEREAKKIIQMVQPDATLKIVDGPRIADSLKMNAAWSCTATVEVLKLASPTPLGAC